eukprot:253062-Chlamydomonas_euryale.AAC.1
MNKQHTDIHSLCAEASISDRNLKGHVPKDRSTAKAPHGSRDPPPRRKPPSRRPPRELHGKRARRPRVAAARPATPSA